MTIERLQDFLRGDDEATPARIGKYEIVHRLGEGGMGVVYEAHDPQLDRRVAVKVLRHRDVEQVRREATAAARLRHPSIVAIHDVGPNFIVMEHVAGTTFGEAMPALDRARRLSVIETIARAIDYAHAQGVVHRDLSPRNILCETTGRALVTDFGLAQLAGGDANVSGVVVGTPRQMAPEQVQGKRVGPAADVWALGVLLYQALCDRPPFDGDTAPTIYEAITGHDPPLPPGAAGAVLARALAKDPARRYPTAAALADDVARLRDGGRVRASRLQAWSWRRVVPIAGVVAGLAVGAVLLRPPRDRHAAWRAREEALTRVLESRPDDIEALVGRASVRMGRADHGRDHGRNPLPDYAAAEADLTTALGRSPADPRLLFRRGRVRTQRAVYQARYGLDPRGDLAAALGDLRAAGNFPGARTWRGNARYHLGAWTLRQGGDARSELAAADEELTPPEDAEALFRRGRVRSVQGRHDEAERDFAEAVRRDPRSPWAWTWRGVARARAGDLAGGRAHIDEALRLDPDHTEGWEQRGRIRARQGDLTGATADWRRAVALDPAQETLLRPLIRQAERAGGR